jgi:hypothetical protein
MPEFKGSGNTPAHHGVGTEHTRIGKKKRGGKRAGSGRKKTGARGRSTTVYFKEHIDRKIDVLSKQRGVSRSQFVNDELTLLIEGMYK